MPNVPDLSARTQAGDFDRFKKFATKIMSVPRSKIQPELDAMKAGKAKPKGRAPRVSGVSSNQD
jgi:hypothetical protein